jgi:hypothetical protein
MGIPFFQKYYTVTEIAGLTLSVFVVGVLDVIGHLKWLDYWEMNTLTHCQ